MLFFNLFHNDSKVLDRPEFKLGIWNRGKFFSDFLISGRRFKLGFTFAYMFYTFKLLPQLKIAGSKLEGDWGEILALME